MSDTVIVAVIGVCGLVVNSWMAFWIRRLEKNTNSIKDALVKVTADAAHASGRREGIEAVTVNPDIKA